jgi:glycosyltransferase involved in cell wall biosynthesis
MTEIAIDARMIHSSGIGTVISSVAPRLITKNRDWRFRLLGDPKVLQSFSWAALPGVDLVPFMAPIHSIAEQLCFPADALRNADLLWSPNYNIPLRWSKPLLVTVHDMAHLALKEMFGSIAQQSYARLMFHRVQKRANAVVYVSKFTADEFHRYVGHPRGRKFVISCGVEEDWFDVEVPSGQRIRPFILFVGNVKPHKNLMRLLDAFAQILNNIPHDLVIVGRKEGFVTGDTAVLKRIADFNGRVKFTGYLSNTELKQLYYTADALVLPSLYEGFGLPPLEAMAAGCPVLVSQLAALPEVCQDAALYCDPLNIEDIAVNLRRIVEDQELRKRLKSKGGVRARQFSWNTSAALYEAAIRQLIAH